MKSWKRKLRMGMVGGGPGAFIGGVHRMAAALDGQIELTAGCFSQDLENTRRTGRELYLDPSRLYATFEEMARAEADLPPDRRIDFVSIVTPNDLHYDVARAFLTRGFHVVCDKPMTWSVAQARKLVELVEETGLVFAVTHNYTGHPLVRQARALFRSGQMGEVRKVIVEYLQDFLVFPHEKHGQKQALWRVDPERAGLAGTLGDCGCHAENLLEYITGERIAALCADLSTYLPDRPLDEDANVLLRLSGGGKGILTVSQIACGEENGLSIRIYGSKGSALWRQENPNYLRVYRYGKPREELTRGSAYLDSGAAAATRVPPGHPEGYLEAFATVYCGVIEAIRRHIDGRPMDIEDYAFPTVHDGLRGMEFIAKAVESSKRNSAWVSME